MIIAIFLLYLHQNWNDMTEIKEKKERTVIHLHLLEQDEHHYFGSIANVYEFYDADTLGIGYGALRNYKCYFLIIIFATGALYECKNRIIFYEFLPIILIYLLFFCFYTGVFF